jgi:malate synthase A
MSALIPIKNDPEANDKAMGGMRTTSARRDRRLRRRLGGASGPGADRDGGVREGARRQAEPDRQAARRRAVEGRNLLDFQPEAPITEAGLRNNINVGIHYLGAWLAGNGCVPIHNLMEDAATAEISRSQVWQWIRSPKGVLDDGRKVTAELVREYTKAELEREALGRRQHSAVRAGRGDLRTDVDVGRLHRIPDAAAVRGNLTARPDPAGSGRRRQAAAGRATRRPAGPGAPRGAFSLAA